jgi:hypothetical protein
MQVSTGAWMYRASCMAGGMAEPPFALGRVIVVRDAGRRPLPKAPASVTVQPDGRTWRISYQTEVPEIMIAQPPGGEQLHVSSPKGPKIVNIRGARGDVHVGLSDLEDGTHTRLREVSVAYSFKDAWVQKLAGTKQLDLKVSGRNLKLWTDYTGLDPETNIGGAANANRGIDWYGTPMSRAWIVSVALHH